MQTKTKGGFRKETRPQCVWCKNPDTDYEPADPENELCHAHLAEYDGVSEAELDRADAEQAEDLFWSYH